MRQSGVAKDRYMQRNWFDEFIEFHVPDEFGRFYLFGVFGPPWIMRCFPRKRCIFFTQEALIGRHQVHASHGIPFVQCGLGFSRNEDARVLRFPYWITRFISPGVGSAKYLSPHAFIESIESWSGDDWDQRRAFASIVCRHDSHGNGAGLRQEILSVINKIESVECAGDWQNNTNRLRQDFNDDINLYLQDCKFNICVENSQSDGYVTEKLWLALLNGSIPIYWGDSNSPEPLILSGNGIVFVDRDNIDKSLDLIKRLSTDEQFREDWMAQSKFVPDAHYAIEQFLLDFAERLVS
jgi:hypothetical protein